MIRVRCIALALSLLCACGATTAALSISDHIKTYKLLESQDFSQLEARYSEYASIREIGIMPSTEAELFFLGLYIGGHDAKSDARRELDLARQWTNASPDSLPAAIQLGRTTLGVVLRQRGNNSANWNEQERLVADALKQLDKVQALGKTDSVWQSTYIRLLGFNGATASQIAERAKTYLLGDSYAGEQFYSEVISYLVSARGDARTHVRELATLANNKNTAHDDQAIYAMVYITALTHDPGLRANPFGPKAMDWKTMDTALSSFSNRFGDSNLYNHHAALACLAGDKARATPLFLRTLKRYPPASSLWATYWGGEAAYNRCKTWALGVQRPA
jgi:hypothetical protein